MQDWLILANIVLFAVNSCFLAFLLISITGLPQSIAVSIRNYMNQLGRKPKNEKEEGAFDIGGIIEAIGGEEVLTEVLKGIVHSVLGKGSSNSRDNIYG